MNENNELAILFPDPIEVVIKEKNETIQVKPFKFKKVFKVIGIIADIAEKLSSSKNESETIFELLSESEAKVFQVLSLAIDKPVDWFDELEGETGFDLVSAVWKVNKSFFDSKVSPLMKEMGFGKREELSNSPKDQEVLTDEEVEKLLNLDLSQTESSTDGQTQ